jgi:pimeloyl-ACP methyl ester carboxylesterase
MTAVDAGLRTDVAEFTSGDGMICNLHHVVGPGAPSRGPVLLVHGAGVRADIFRAPESVNLVGALVAEGWDVWLENWRASIDLPANPWDLDQAAVFDHPRAVAHVLRATGADTLKAVVHCQGSTSFTLAAVAGLLDSVDLIVSNAVSLHPVIPPFARFKISYIAPLLANFKPYVNPHWGADPSTRGLDKAIVDTVDLTHHECSNRVCKMVSFTYGSGHPALWSHDNLSRATHDWLRSEFGPVPMTFFAQMAQCVAAGRLVTLGTVPGLPGNPVSKPPRTDARFVLLAGADNRCFLPDSQRRTFEYLDHHRPDFHRLHILPGYGHLDVFMGKFAVRDTIPLILSELSS